MPEPVNVPGLDEPLPAARDDAAPVAPRPGTINAADAAEQAAAHEYAETAARRAGATWHGPEWHQQADAAKEAAYTRQRAAIDARITPSWRWARANTTSQEGTDDGN